MKDVFIQTTKVITHNKTFFLNACLLIAFSLKQHPLHELSDGKCQGWGFIIQ